VIIATMACAAPASAAADTLVTVAGTGTAGSLGDNSMAAAAQLNGARGMARLGDGSLLVADTVNNRIRRIAPDGIITTVAGIGTAGGVGDNGPATSAQLNGPRDVAVAPDGVTYFIADTANNRIRRVDAGGTITTVAGSGTAGFVGDGAPATLANLNGPSGVAVTATGGLLIADTTNSRVRLVAAGIINTVAGNGTAASTGDGSPANLASINLPQDVSVATGGAYLIADTAGNRIRRVDAGGTISTVAGSGTACAATTSLCGDYGPAVLAQLNGPASVAADAADTGFLVADTTDNRVRRVAPGATITTLAGSGTACATSTSLCGDAGPAGLASLNAPRGVLELPDGITVVSDTGTNRLRARVPESPGAAGPMGPAGPAGPTGPSGPAGSPGTAGATGTNATTRQLAVAFASVKLTARTAVTTKLRIVVTNPAVVVVRISLAGRTVVTRRVEYRLGGRKQLSVGRLRAGTYAVTLTATDGAATAVDHARLRVLPQRSPKRTSAPARARAR
jgi:sugar lactone lactonase YvrE